ncbi:MAG TPA: sugar-binding domain-containing protein [Polyangia bacterium]|nr:sugar-binding domain-containing protein [Polyangia bacterium]
MALSHEELLELVRLRMAPLKRGQKMLSYKRLRAEHPETFGRLSAVALGEEFVRAFKEELVAVKVTSIKPPEEDRQLAARLIDAFDHLSLAHAIVVKRRDERSLPADLGLAAAHDLSGRLRNGERIGVAAGQTVCWLSRYMRDFFRIRAKKITFVSMTGIFCARQRGHGPNEELLRGTRPAADGERSNILIDADINAIRMAQAVQSHVEFVLVASPAVGHFAQARGLMARNSWLGARDGKSRRTLDRAVVGIGALYDNWRLIDAVNARNPDHPIRRDLDRLRMICTGGAKEVSGGRLWWPVFDVANHLMLAEPRDGCRLSPRDCRAARDLVRRLNERVLTVSERDLKAAKLYAIAGGPRKSYPIYDALHAFDIETLVTDDVTARDLLAIQVASKN